MADDGSGFEGAEGEEEQEEEEEEDGEDGDGDAEGDAAEEEGEEDEEGGEEEGEEDDEDDEDDEGQRPRDSAGPSSGRLPTEDDFFRLGDMEARANLAREPAPRSLARPKIWRRRRASDPPRPAGVCP